MWTFFPLGRSVELQSPDDHGSGYSGVNVCDAEIITAPGSLARRRLAGGTEGFSGYIPPSNRSCASWSG
jgi:hypothetical protein